jgi:hypothetical protein
MDFKALHIESLQIINRSTKFSGEIRGNCVIDSTRLGGRLSDVIEQSGKPGKNKTDRHCVANHSANMCAENGRVLVLGASRVGLFYIAGDGQNCTKRICQGQTKYANRPGDKDRLGKKPYRGKNQDGELCESQLGFVVIHGVEVFMIWAQGNAYLTKQNIGSATKNFTDLARNNAGYPLVKKGTCGTRSNT